MNKLFRLSWVLTLSLAALACVLILAQVASAESKAPAPQAAWAVVQEPMSTLATTLTLSIPDMAIATNATKTLDLWNYVTYETVLLPNLVFTATQTSGGSYLQIELVNEHYLQMTALTTICPRYSDITVDVGDGITTTADDFEVTIECPPDLDFYHGYVYNNVPDPLRIDAGMTSTLMVGEDAVSLEYYTWDDSSSDSWAYSIANTPAISLGVHIITGTSSDCPGGGCRLIVFSPTVDLFGTHLVRVQVEDSTGLTDTDVITVAVMHKVFLPLVQKNYAAAPFLHPIDNPDGDGDYWLEWDAPSRSPVYYETEFSFNDPTFANGQKADQGGNTSQHGYFTWPGTHYWRVHGVYYENSQYVPGPWSNVQSTTVGQFAYLWINNDSYAFTMRVDISGNGINDTITYDTRTTGFWRSVPVGTYTFNIHNELCWPDDRSEVKSLVNTIAGGAWYLIDTCEPISGPTTTPY